MNKKEAQKLTRETIGKRISELENFLKQVDKDILKANNNLDKLQVKGRKLQFRDSKVYKATEKQFRKAKKELNTLSTQYIESVKEKFYLQQEAIRRYLNRIDK